MARCTVQRGRFLGFAGGHFVVSAVSVPLWLLAADPAAEPELEPELPEPEPST